MKTTGHMLLHRSIEKNEDMETFKSELKLERMKLENGRFQTLFRESVKFLNFEKMFGASYFSLKITPKFRI